MNVEVGRKKKEKRGRIKTRRITCKNGERVEKKSEESSEKERKKMRRKRKRMGKGGRKK